MARMFMKLGDIKGETTDGDHKDWCGLLSMSTGVTNIASEASRTGGRTGGSSRFSDITVTKEVDTATADIMIHCANGILIPEVTIELCVAVGGSEDHKLCIYTLKNAMITSQSIGANDSPERPNETLSLAFGEISLEYNATDDSHAAGANVKRGWNLQTNKKV